MLPFKKLKISALIFAGLLTACGAAHTTQLTPVADCKTENPRIPRNITLSRSCPGGLKKKQDGLCYYDIFYQKYSLNEGGLRRPINITRDGFSPQVIDLGRLLFFDPLLSGDRRTSCAHCHHPTYGLGDGRAQAMGAGGCGVGANRRGGVKLTRSAPSLWNAAFMKNFFWDGRSVSLEEQARGPLFAPYEMNNKPAALEKALNENPMYRKLFRQAFGARVASKITVELVTRALADFERTLISFNSRYDRYVQGEADALTTLEMQGFNVFRSFITRCAECHPPPLFTNGQSAVIGAPDRKGLQPDPGRESLSGSKLHRGDFRIPGLRNIARTGPYMHSGALEDLEQVINFYNEGGGRDRSRDLDINWHIRDINITAQERKSLAAFLHTLNDESNNPRIPDHLPSGLKPAR